MEEQYLTQPIQTKPPQLPCRKNSGRRGLQGKGGPAPQSQALHVSWARGRPPGTP